MSGIGSRDGSESFTIVTGGEVHAARMQPIQPDATVHCVIRLCEKRRPIVSIQQVIGGTTDYRPAELRAIAAKLRAIATDAESHPDGRPDFLPSYRRY